MGRRARGRDRGGNQAAGRGGCAASNCRAQGTAKLGPAPHFQRAASVHPAASAGHCVRVPRAERPRLACRQGSRERGHTLALHVSVCLAAKGAQVRAGAVHVAAHRRRAAGGGWSAHAGRCSRTRSCDCSASRSPRMGQPATTLLLSVHGVYSVPKKSLTPQVFRAVTSPRLPGPEAARARGRAGSECRGSRGGAAPGRRHTAWSTATWR